MPKAESQVPPPIVLHGSGLADWAESAMLIEDRKNLSRSTLRQRLRNSAFVEGDELDVHVDLLLAEITARASVAPHMYPFRETSTGVARDEQVGEAAYEFMLWLSVSPRYREERRFDETEQLFDHLVKQALTGYLGEGARAVRFAHPSSDGRPPGFRDAVRWLAGLLNLGVGAAEPRPRRKDGGVDVVAWRPFRDARPGFIVILCQCTAQQDWVPKAKDIVVDQWRGWIDFARDPSTALAIPFAIGSGFDRWDELRRTVTMVLDRLRLCELLNPWQLEYLEELRTWTETERGLLGAVPEQ
jgi:hypothetical protein